MSPRLRRATRTCTTLLVGDADGSGPLISELARRGVHAVFHYVPLHSSPGGERYGRAHGSLDETDRASDGLVRLPLWYGMPEEAVDRIAFAVAEAVGG